MLGKGRTASDSLVSQIMTVLDLVATLVAVAALVVGGTYLDHVRRVAPRAATQRLEATGLALNAHDQVVGYAFDYSTTFVERAFLYDARLDPPMRDLNDLIPADSRIVLNRATGINDDGIIVGYGTVGGRFHAFVLSPSPS